MLDGRKIQELHEKIDLRLKEWEDRPWNEMSRAGIIDSVQHELYLWGMNYEDVRYSIDSIEITVTDGMYGKQVQVDMKLPPSAMQVDLIIRKEK